MIKPTSPKPLGDHRHRCCNRKYHLNKASQVIFYEMEANTTLFDLPADVRKLIWKQCRRLVFRGRCADFEIMFQDSQRRKHVGHHSGFWKTIPVYELTLDIEMEGEGNIYSFFRGIWNLEGAGIPDSAGLSVYSHHCRVFKSSRCTASYVQHANSNTWLSFVCDGFEYEGWPADTVAES